MRCESNATTDRRQRPNAEQNGANRKATRKGTEMRCRPSSAICPLTYRAKQWAKECAEGRGQGTFARFWRAKRWGGVFFGPGGVAGGFTSPTFIVGHAQQNSSIFAMTLSRDTPEYSIRDRGWRHATAALRESNTHPHRRPLYWPARFQEDALGTCSARYMRRRTVTEPSTRRDSYGMTCIPK